LKFNQENNILVKNISKKINGREFYLMMKSFGEIKKCKFYVDLFGTPKGYGCVYYSKVESADAAINSLNGKIHIDLTLIVCKLIPGITKENFRNNIYVKNLPKYFTNEDLRNLFLPYGNIKSVSVSTDDSDSCKGFGFICFYNAGHANLAFKEIKSKSIRYDNCEPLYLNYAKKKEERIERILKDNLKNKNLTVFAKLRTDSYMIKCEEDFTQEIQNFVNLLLLKDFIIVKISVKMETKTAMVIFSSQTEVVTLIDNYIKYCNYNVPKVFLNFYMNKNEREMTHSFIKELNKMYDPLHMFSHFDSLSVIDPNKKPVIKADNLDKNENRAIFKENSYEIEKKNSEFFNNKKTYNHCKNRDNYNSQSQNFVGKYYADKHNLPKYGRKNKNKLKNGYYHNWGYNNYKFSYRQYLPTKIDRNAFEILPENSKVYEITKNNNEDERNEELAEKLFENIEKIYPK